MKYRYFLLFFIGSLVWGYSGFSQLVTDNVFMQGRYLEGVMAPNGSWGNSITVPAGYHTHSGGDAYYTDPITGTSPSGNGMDFNYDGNRAGWVVAGGPPGFYPAVYGPYYMPGTPYDGWAMQVNGIRSDAWYTNIGFWNATGGSLTGTCTGFAYTPASGVTLTPSMQVGTWTGTDLGLAITQQTRIDTYASWAVVTTKFVNTTTSTMTGLYYWVSADPDNDETDSLGGFPTDNHICYQDDAVHRVEVYAYPADPYHPTIFSGLCTKDCRAKAMIYASWPPPESSTYTLDQVWNETATWISTNTYALYGGFTDEDWAYGLIYNLGNLAPGDSLALSFAWIFTDSNDIDTAFPNPQLVALGNAYDSTDTVNQCTMSGPGVSGTTFEVSLLGGADKVWTFSNWTWAPATGLSATTGTIVTVNFADIAGETTYTITGIQDTAHGMCGTPLRFYLTVIPCFSATNNSPICVTDTLFLYGHDHDSLGATFLWTGPGGYISHLQDPHRYPLTMADTGWYYVTRTLGTSSVTDSTHVSLKPLPVLIPGTNAPICSGLPNVLDLTVTPDSPADETFAWSGPNGFTSALENPTISGPSVSYSGIYKVVAVLNGCADSITETVIIDTTPAQPTVSSNSPLCSPRDAVTGQTLDLFSNDATPGVSYSWGGPGGFLALVQNPTYSLVPTSASGVYTVTVTIGADGITCTNFNTITVAVDSTPFLPALASNAPVCSGTTLALTAASTALSVYSWTGPDLFTSSLQNPSIIGVITAATGTYSVTATLIYPDTTCLSDTATLYVVVDSTPQVPIASSNSPGIPSICEFTDTLFLTAADSTAGVTWYWAGPDLFTSTNENPSLPNVVAAASGQYTVTATLDSACSASTIINVDITPTPLVTATNNGPICTGVGDTLFLQATSNPGATFSWLGPLTFLSTQQYVFRTPVIMEMAGIYQVTAFLNGCYSLPVNDTVVILQTPPPVWVKDTSFCQYYDAPPLQAFGDSVLWYASSVPGAPATLTAPVPPTASDTIMWFYVTQTRLGCTSSMDSFEVVVNPKPVLTVNPSVNICPHDSVILMATDSDPQITYHWAPPMYLSDTTSAMVIAKPITSVTYEAVTTNQYGCRDTAFTSITVNAGALLYLGDSTVTLYPGQTYQMNPQTNCTSFAWTPEAGLTSATIPNPVASPEVSTKYVLVGTTNWGCMATDSININVDPNSILALPNAFTPGGAGPNNQFKIILEGVATLNYFRIFDRWGNVVFETTDINQGWDGTYKGTPQPFGVYVYVVSAVASNGQTFEKHGNVTLLR